MQAVTDLVQRRNEALASRTRAAILRATIAVIARHSLSGTTVQQIGPSRGFGADDLRRVAGFESVSEEHAARFLGVGREERFRTGQVVTERWAYARTFYIVLDGELTVTVDGIEVNRLTGGDSFGEIAAIDWGRDFSYGRTATVTTTAPTRLLAIPGAALRELMLDAPAIDASIRQTAYDRMHVASRS